MALGASLPTKPQPPVARLSPPPPKVVADALGVATLTIEWLAGDGSDRCYYRIRTPEKSKSFVLMQLSGSDLENLRSGSYDWVEISKILTESKVTVPRPVVTLRDFGALIIDDYGDDMLESVALLAHRNASISQVLPLYDLCLKTLSQFISLRPSGACAWTRRSFDEPRFVWELDFFVTKYLEGVCRRPLDDDEKTLFHQDSQALAKYLAAGSKYFVHRDFHSRNVMVQDGEVAVIDFQDARLGPISYDLVSLCFDSYVPFSGGERMAMLEKGLALFAKDHGMVLAEEARAQWKPMLLQRQIKAIGSFGYLTVDKQKGDYLKNVAPALTTLLEARVVDSRWPFISGQLLDIMQETLPTRHGKASGALT